MDRYQISTPRAPFVIAAIALTALTLGASVIAPMKLDPGVRETGALAQQQIVAPTPAVFSLARIEVCAPREPESPVVQVRHVHLKPKQSS